MSVSPTFSGWQVSIPDMTPRYGRVVTRADLKHPRKIHPTCGRHEMTRKASGCNPADGQASSGALHIRLLGGFGIANEATGALSLSGRRQGTLVAYLLLHRDTASDRKHLAFLLLPDL